MKMKFKEAVAQWRSDDIKQFVIMLGGTSKVTRKADRVDFVCSKMLSETVIRARWQELDEVSQRAVSSAYHNNGVFNKTAFQAHYGALPPRPEEPDRWYYRELPILFDLFVVDDAIPVDLMPLLTDLVLPLERFLLAGIEVLPSELVHKEHVWKVVSAETTLIGRTDMLTYLQMIEQKQIKFGAKNNQLTAASVRKVLKNLLDGDFHEPPPRMTVRNTVRPFGLDTFAKESKLTTRTGKLTRLGREYLQSQNSESMLTAFETWSETGKFDEIFRINNLSGLKSRGTSLTVAASRREKVIEALSWCPTDVWIHIRDFYRAILIWGFDFEVEAQDHTNLYVGSRYYGELYAGNYWDVVNGLYINAIIWEYLATIGAVDIAFFENKDVTLLEYTHDYLYQPVSQYDGLLYFRINKWGAFLLGQADVYEPPQPSQKALFTIDNDRRLFLIADLLPNERLQLEAIANQIDPQTYQIEADKLLTAVESGLSLTQLIAFAENHHQGKLPAKVSDWLKNIENNQGLFVKTGDAVLIELNQHGLLTKIQKDKSLSKMFLKINSKTIVVKSTHLKRFQKRLKSLGFLVK